MVFDLRMEDLRMFKYLLTSVLLETELATSEVAEKAEEAKAFFNRENLTNLVTQFADSALAKLIDIIIAIIIWKIAKYVIKWVLKISNKAFEKAGLDIGVIKFLCSFIKIAIYAVVLLVILDILGFQTASLIAVFGSAALALSMSLQGSLSNMAGGILILLFKPFRVGDYIISGSCEGTVVSIEILYTKLRTPDNKIVMMPNGALANSNIVNVGAEGVRRLDINVGIGYGSDVTKAKEILRGIIEEYPLVLKDKGVDVIVKSLDESCVTLETRCWVNQDTYWDTRFIFLERFKQEFDKNGIEIPFNQLDVHVK
jgi:small conductance mechanosensitive channel